MENHEFKIVVHGDCSRLEAEMLLKGILEDREGSIDVALAHHTGPGSYIELDS